MKSHSSPPWYSSYEENNYGDLFYSLIRVYKPDKVVELGTKAGFSAYHIARALRANGRGSLDCYDLWEKYKYNSVPKSVALKNLKEFKDIINFKLTDVTDIDKAYKTIDILHVDLSNSGEILDKIIPKWIDKTRGFIIIEGGSDKRDKIEWMTKFKKIPIKQWLLNFAHCRGDIEYLTFEPFPSVTIIRKK
jgi:hypothetical protein